MNEPSGTAPRTRAEHAPRPGRRSRVLPRALPCVFALTAALLPAASIHAGEFEDASSKLSDMEERVRSISSEFRETAPVDPAIAMRRILVDHARTRRAEKRGGPDVQRVPLDEAVNTPIDVRLDFERLDDALEELAAFAPEQARVVELRYFVGLSIEETADVMEVSPATVKRHWAFARAWLLRALNGAEPLES